MSIASIAYHLGELRPIEEIDFLQDDARKLELYKLAGFEAFAHSDLSMCELARASAAQTLADSSLRPEDIAICIYVAESFDRDEPVRSSEVNRLLCELGLENTVPLHVSVSNCANIVSAVRVAAALVADQAVANVLIISVDKASRRYGGRMMFQEMSIKSDIAVSCLVSATGSGLYDIMYIGQRNAASLANAEVENSASYSVPKFKSLRLAVKDAEAHLGFKPQDYRKIITNNYSRQVTKMFMELCGFSENTGHFDNIPRFAHAVAGDVLINLKDMESDLTSGDRVILMSDSINVTSVLCLQRR